MLARAHPQGDFKDTFVVGFPVFLLDFISRSVWDCNTGKCIETLKVRPVAIAPNGSERPAKRLGVGRTCIPQAH